MVYAAIPFPITPGEYQPGSMVMSLARQNILELVTKRKEFFAYIGAMPAYGMSRDGLPSHTDIGSALQYIKNGQMVRSAINVIFKSLNEVQAAQIQECLAGDYAKTKIYNNPKKASKVLDELYFTSSQIADDNYLSLPHLVTTKQLLFPKDMIHYTKFNKFEGEVYHHIARQAGYGTLKATHLNDESAMFIESMAEAQGCNAIYPVQFVAKYTPACTNTINGLVYTQEAFAYHYRNHKSDEELLALNSFSPMRDSWDMFCVEPNKISLMYHCASLAEVKKDLAQYEKEFIDPYYNSQRLYWAENEMTKIPGYDPTHHSKLDCRYESFDKKYVPQDESLNLTLGLN